MPLQPEEITAHIQKSVDAAQKSGNCKAHLAATVAAKGHHGSQSVVRVKLLSLMVLCASLTSRTAVKFAQQCRGIATRKVRQFGPNELVDRVVLVSVTQLADVLKEAKVSPAIPQQTSVAELLQFLVAANIVPDPELRDDYFDTIETPAELQLYCNDNGCRLVVADLLQAEAEPAKASSPPAKK